MFNKESNYIRRTSDPKYTTYISDGCGRDKYILINNGGIERRSSSIQYKENYPGKHYDYNCVYKEITKMTVGTLDVDWAASNSE
jgi:hypothetical protein